MTKRTWQQKGNQILLIYLRGWQPKCRAQLLSCVQLFVIAWTVACLAPLSVGFSRQEYWIELPFSPTGDLPDLGIEPTSPVSPALAGGFCDSQRAGPNCRKAIIIQPRKAISYPDIIQDSWKYLYFQEQGLKGHFQVRNLHFKLTLIFIEDIRHG